MEVKVKSFIKYVGGKSKLLKYIIENLPNDFNNYFEPFVGGGSVILGIISSQEKNRSYTISDINSSLINCYYIIQNNLDELIIELSNEKYKNESIEYYINRARFNKLKFLDNHKVECAALFIYLNKCGYNGMYRENKSGEFNIPFGTMKNPSICDNESLLNVKKYIKEINILCCKYEDILENITDGDFVYMDSPYDGTFSDYTSNKFGKSEQISLKLFVDILTSKKVKVMLSNSCTEFIKDLYKDYYQIILNTKYSLGGKNASRGNKSELLIKNYID